MTALALSARRPERGLEKSQIHNQFFQINFISELILSVTSDTTSYTTSTNLAKNCLVFNDELPVEQGAEFDNVEEDGHLRSRLVFEVGQLERFLTLSLAKV